MTNTFDAAANEFHLRYFDWCINQIRLAAREDFRHVKGIRGHYAGIFQDFLERFGPCEGSNVCLARLRKAHPGVLRMKGESLSPSDDLSIKKFSEFTRIGGTVMRIPEIIRARWPNGNEPGLEDNLDEDEIRTILNANLSKHFGPPVKRGARGLIEFRHRIHDWMVFTNIAAEEDSGKWSIRYAHTISVFSDLDAQLIGSSISYLAWLGFPTTQWDYVLREDLNLIASMLSEFIEMFLSSAPALLNGIRNPRRLF